MLWSFVLAKREVASVIPSTNLQAMSQVGLESKLEAFQNLSKTSETLSIRDLHGFGRCHCNMHICSRCVNLIHTDTTIVVGGTNCNCGVLGAV